MKNLLSLCLGVALLAACRKDDIIICEPSTTKMAEVRQAAPPVQTFTFDLGQAQNIRTTGGATISFAANAFRLPDGRALATGQAQLRVREIYTVPDMILANMPTSSAFNQQVLISGGEFNIQVWQGNTRLRLMAPGLTSAPQPLTLTSPQPTTGLDTTPMHIWVLSPGAFSSATLDTAGWRGAYSLGTGLISPVVGGYYNAQLALDSIGWWNIDQFWHAYSNNTIAQMLVDVPAGASTTRVYFRPVGYNGLARCRTDAAATRWNCPLPNGADVMAVVLQERDSQLYYGTQRVTVQPGLLITPTLEALSAEEIVRRIRQL